MTTGGSGAAWPDGLPVAAPAFPGWTFVPQPGAVPLGPLDVNDMVRGVFTTFRRYCLPLYLPLLTVALGCTAVVSGCAYAAWRLIASLHLRGHWETTGRLVEVSAAAAVVVVPSVVCAAFAYAVATTVSLTVLGHHAVLGTQPLRARQAWAEARPHLRRTLATQALSTLAGSAVLLVSLLPGIALGIALHSVVAAAFGLLLLVPGLVGTAYVTGRLYLAGPAAVLEGLRPSAAIHRSWQLSRGAWWRTFGIMLIPTVVGSTATQVVNTLGGTVASPFVPSGLLDRTQPGRPLHLELAALVLPAAIVVLAAIAAAITRAPLKPLTTGLLYLDRCIRREGLQIPLTAVAAGAAVGPAPFPLLPFPPRNPPPKRRREQDRERPTDTAPPHNDQRRVTGYRLIGIGWVLRIAGTCLGMAGLAVFRDSLGNEVSGSGGLSPWLVRAAGIPVFYLGLRMWARGRIMVARGRQHTVKVIGSLTKLVFSRYVLYLRPFSHDREMSALPTQFSGGHSGQLAFFLSGLTQEELLVRRFGGIGRVIAIGEPEESLPLPGAMRGYLPLDDWQGPVSGLIRNAHVVALAAGTGPGTLWEFTEAVRVLDLRRLVLLVYCGPEMYDAFREAVRTTYDERSSPGPGDPAHGRDAWPPLPELPDFPPLFRPRRKQRKIMRYLGAAPADWDFPLKGIVVFDEEGRARFIRFDPTAQVRTPWNLWRMVRRQFAPVISGLEALPRQWNGF
ncbi:hypothetical protein [Streptacidiphilus cavernicola]|uniref:Uncharacterized protein n=1 Tax=Streptacidiphilus cavernicola TaxID=3342716 RepID=A0ABV6VSL4_9ACTN